MRICTWNAARGRAEAKLPSLLREEPDLMAVQEIGEPPKGFPGSWSWKPAANGQANQGILLWTKAPYGIRRIETVKFKTELYLAAEVHLHGRHLFNAVCMWVKPYAKKPKNWSCPYYYSVSMALDAVIRNLADRPTVLLGDSNIVNPDSKEYYARLLEMFGLLSAYHEFFNEPPGQETRHTHRHRGRRKGLFHIDWCFLPSTWQNGLLGVSLGAERQWGQLSDHFPITVEVDDSALPSTHWNPPAVRSLAQAETLVAADRTSLSLAEVQKLVKELGDLVMRGTAQDLDPRDRQDYEAELDKAAASLNEMLDDLAEISSDLQRAIRCCKRYL